VADFYRWLIFAHVLAAFAFVLAHGASAAVVFRLRRERDPDRVRSLLELSRLSTTPANIALMVLLIAGIWAGIDHAIFTSGRLWIWAAVIVLLIVIGAMGALISRHYYPLRARFEHGPPLTEQELDGVLGSSQPFWGAVIGLVGLVVLLWLMMFRPF
jgi:hypothetical protein